VAAGSVAIVGLTYQLDDGQMVLRVHLGDIGEADIGEADIGEATSARLRRRISTGR